MYNAQMDIYTVETLELSNQTHGQNNFGFNNKSHRWNGFKKKRIISFVCEKGCKIPTVLSQISLSYLGQILVVAKTLDHPVTYILLKLIILKQKL